jgi:thioesterase domain-containing protein
VSAHPKAPGDHVTMMSEPNVQTLAQTLARVMTGTSS